MRFWERPVSKRFVERLFSAPLIGALYMFEVTAFGRVREAIPFAIVVGAGLGLVAHALIAIKDWAQRRPEPGLARTLFERLGVVMWLHASALFLAMAQWPRLYFFSIWSHVQPARIGVPAIAAISLLGIALFLWPKWRRVDPKRLVLGLACAVIGAAIGWQIDRQPRRTVPLPLQAKRRPSVLVLSGDFMKTPLADKSTQFARTYTDGGGAAETWASVLTGLYPQHRRQDPLPTLPANLRGQGWVTAVVSADAGWSTFGWTYTHVASAPLAIERPRIAGVTALLPFLHARPFRQVFPSFDRWVAVQDPDIVADEAIAVLREVKANPFFLVVDFAAPQTVDVAAARVLDTLSEIGATGDTIVVITGAHGDALEGFEARHVALSIYDPRLGQPRVERRVVAHVDVTPTLEELLGVTPVTKEDGRSLVKAMRGEAIEPRPVFGVVGGARMVRNDRYGLVHVPAAKSYRLYDLDNDPNEKQDVLEEQLETARTLGDALRGWMPEDPSKGPPTKMDPARTP